MEGTDEAECILVLPRLDGVCVGAGTRPPPGHGVHHYKFKLCALTKPGATKAEVLKAMQGHIIGEGELTGTYES